MSAMERLTAAVDDFGICLRGGRHLGRVRVLLADVYTPAGVRMWLTSSNKNLGHHTPLELLLDGFGEMVVAEAERLAAS